MKTDEMKLRLKRFINKTIDLYLPCSNLINKLENATAKLYIEQHMGSINKILDIFADENGEIDENIVLKSYEESLFGEKDEFQLNIKDMLESRMSPNITAFLPDKVILFKREDLYNILM